MSHEYEWSDAWLLQAIIIGGNEDQGATLFNIISAGDALNHAIFTNDELESGFARLTAGGLIEERQGRFLATDKAKSLYSRSSKTGSIHSIRDRLAKNMGAAAWQPNCPNAKNIQNYPGFSPEKVGQAIREWQEEARGMIDRIVKKRRTKASSGPGGKRGGDS